MPLHRRVPKRGFTNIFRKEYQIVNLERLLELGEKNITQEILVKHRLAGKNDLIKVLGDGELKVALTVYAHKFSKSAQEKITKAGGKAEVIGAAAVAEEPAKQAAKKPKKLQNVRENSQYLPRARPAQACAVCAGDAGGLPSGFAHPHAWNQSRGAG